jgi:hypothetical protein
MTTSKLARSPIVHRSGAILATAFLLAAGAQQAGAAPSTSGSGGSSEGGTAAATAGQSAGTASTSSSSSKATTGGSACPAQVQITFGPMSVSGGMVTISFSQNAHGCASAQPARLHIHQNLLSAPRAGSDPEHQWNTDLDIGPSHGDSVTVPLLESADGKCFVQVDAHASGHSRGQFFPTATCTSATPSSPASSSPAPSSTPPSSTASSSTASSSVAASSTARTSSAPGSSSAAPSTTSQSLLPASTSRAATTHSYFPVAQVAQSPSGGALASTGSRTVLPVGIGAVFAIVGAWLVSASRRPRRH